MQGDLISRSALIEEIETQLKEVVDEDGMTSDVRLLISICEKFKKIIKRMPTAYNVEKVVAELEYKKEQADKDRSWWGEHSWKDNVVYNECDLSDRKVDCYDEALDCVRNGGKE